MNVPTNPTSGSLPPESNVVQTKIWARRNVLFFTALYVLGAVWGARHAYYWLPSIIDITFQVAMMLALSCWAISDSIARGSPIPTFARVWYFFFAILLVPIYVLRTRGWRGAAWLVFHIVAWSILVMLAQLSMGIVIALAKGQVQ